MPEAPLATRPDHSFSVLASAGTGKTWQLVARLTRLLLHDVPPDSILAITFTRKAAGEMQERLGQRLRELMEADDEQLDRLLADIGETSPQRLREKARKLLENWLLSEQGLRTTTFHSFCQDLLQRFPLEAGLPPGFELAEQTGLLAGESWDALFAEATAAPGGTLATSLEVLFEQLNGLHNTRIALYRFLEHRGDWWAFTRGSEEPVVSAVRHLEEQLQLKDRTVSCEDFWNNDTQTELAEFAGLLGRHDTKTNLQHITVLEDALSGEKNCDNSIQLIREVFFTGKRARRQRSSKQSQRKAMGESGEDRFLELNERLCARLEQQFEMRNRVHTLTTNSAWYQVGQRMLEHFQRIKRERRLLDFADLEWKAWELLNHPQHAHWIQYKLDQRIDHLLVDEFQDTNPTQWQLILPLLQEMAAGTERMRSLFLVGDSKQSIYRFRRGNPRLLDCAATWMQKNLNATSVHLDHSWRSSPAVLDVVNKVFCHEMMRDVLASFQPHTTHRTEAWGRVELWPLIEADEAREAPAGTGLRNPLLHARPACVDQRHYREGQAIAKRIQELVTNGVAVYNDVLILMRSRTHLSDYESALRDAAIPYLSLDRGTLLHSLEIRDLEALLLVLMTPQDNLSLAQVLRSPIFSVSDRDLIQLAQGSGGSWFERLQALGTALAAEHPLCRASRLLSDWHGLAGQVPIHDLLERIFHQANLLNRYEAAFPPSQVARVRANLTRFIELALEVDSGRYPTLPRFLQRVRQLRSLDKEGPDQATPESETGERVRLLTIHAAKGLEAPVVFLADTASESRGMPGCQTLVQWPAEADRPSDFMLLSNSSRRDSVSAARHQIEVTEDNRESANLLYVAMTRARHMLVISGCAPRARTRIAGWYKQVARALCEQDAPDRHWIHEFGQPDTGRHAEQRAEVNSIEVDPRLRGTISAQPVSREIAPSRAALEMEFNEGDEAGRVRGLAMHRMFQLTTETSPDKHPSADILHRIAMELQLDNDDSMLNACWKEARLCMQAPELAWLFEPADNDNVYNEVAIQYRLDNQTVYGIIDRLLCSDSEAHIVDYKSHRIGDEFQLQKLVEQYRPQLEMYRAGVCRLWKERRVRCYLLFTDGAHLVEI